ncbi:substrate-binding domain-containing protein, partial [Bacteroides uniformis]
LPIEQDWIQYGDYSYEAGQTIMQHWADLKLSAVVAASDLVAMGIMRQAAQMGIKVPQDLSIVSIDGTFLC